MIRRPPHGAVKQPGLGAAPTAAQKSVVAALRAACRHGVRIGRLAPAHPLPARFLHRKPWIVVLDDRTKLGGPGLFRQTALRTLVAVTDLLVIDSACAGAVVVQLAATAAGRGHGVMVVECLSVRHAAWTRFADEQAPATLKVLEAVTAAEGAAAMICCRRQGAAA